MVKRLQAFFDVTAQEILEGSEGQTLFIYKIKISYLLLARACDQTPVNDLFIRKAWSCTWSCCYSCLLEATRA